MTFFVLLQSPTPPKIHLSKIHLIKSLLRSGLHLLRRERAIQAYRREEVTLSRAAELAGG